MDRHTMHELHSTRVQANLSTAPVDFDALPRSPALPRAAQVLVINERDRSYFIRANDLTGELFTCDEGTARVEVRIVERRLRPALVVAPCGNGVFVNGLPLIGLKVLLPGDLLVVAAGVHTFVTQRFRPYVGPPRDGVIGSKCPVCNIAIEADTRVVTHMCGLAYHHETADSHPEVPEKDRLNCFDRAPRNCVSCRRELGLDEILVWDPAAMYGGHE